MLGKTPAVVALAAVFTMCAGVRPCTAQSASPAPPSVEAEQARFDAWRDRFRARALKAGIPHSVFKKALGNVQPDPTVHEKNEDQPEFARPVWEYLDGALSESRIANGRKMLRRHASLLADAERKWGVPRHFLVAIWGMETSYGALLGNHNIFEALATLSYRGGRAKYGEEQLLAALRLLADGHKPLEAMKGSWAGAVGHTQFVPTTYLKFAVDGDKDGRRDLWDSLSDVFHSTAHYLKKSGFDRNLKWGREAFLPDDFDYALAGYHVTRPLSEWRELGIRMGNGKLVPEMDIEASILVPAGHQGPAFLIYENFHAILAYNRSTNYALAIGLLSDRLRGGPSLKQSWPRHLKPLRRDERLEVQRRLKALGYGVTKVDAVLGRETRAAIQAFQKNQGDVADGYATSELLTKLRAAGPAEMASAESASGESTQASEESPQADDVAMLDAGAENAGTEGEAGGAEAEARVERDAAGGRETDTGAAEDSENAVTGETEVAREMEAGSAHETGGEAAAGTDVAAESESHPAPGSAAEQTAAANGPAESEDVPRPRAKPAAAEAETSETGTGTDTPLPRAKPVAVAAGTAPASRSGAAATAATGDVSAQSEGHAAPQLKRRQSPGVTSALAAPGLVIMGNGTAAPLPGPKQASATAPASGSAPQEVPLNNGAELIVSPPGIAYVGAEEKKADQVGPAAADGGGAEPASGEDEVSKRPGASGSDPGS